MHMKKEKLIYYQTYKKKMGCNSYVLLFYRRYIICLYICLKYELNNNKLMSKYFKINFLYILNLSLLHLKNLFIEKGFLLYCSLNIK